MKVQYFEDTDTLYISFRDGDISQARDLDENTLIEMDAAGQVCAITLEHASQRADVGNFSMERVAA